MKPALSVVIPSCNRAERLCATLTSLEAQLETGRLEVIVADDGSTDDTADRLAVFKPTSFTLKTVRLQHEGPATARNRAIEVARADRVLLLGDDTWPERGALQEHLSRAPPLALQGRIDWDPTKPITPIMEFLAPNGPQFYFKGLRDGDPLPYWRVLGSNLSAPRAWFLHEPFDEGMPYAAFEDTELAYRWKKRGWTASYSASARCFHDHRYDSLEPFLEKQRQAGVSARRAIRRHLGLLGRAALHPLFLGTLTAARKSFLGRLRRADQRRSWDLRTRLAFARGLLSRPTPEVSPH